MNNDNNKIRILQVLDKCAIRGSPIHGVSRLLLTWWPEFQYGDTELSLCVLRGAGGCEDFKKAGIAVEDLDRGKLNPRTVIDLLKIIKRDQIDILHCHGYGATTFGRIAGFLTRTPVIVHEHMVDAHMPVYQKFADLVLSPFTSKGIAISAAVKDFMAGPRSVPSSRIEIVHNSVPADFCRTFSDSEKQAAAQKYGIPLDVKIIGIVGRLDPVKGHKDFLLAASIVVKKFPDIRFVVVGDGELREQLHEYARELEIEDKVIFLGHCNNVMEIVALFYMLAVTSLSEGFSIAIAEAMAQGKPVVATRIGGIPDIVEDGKSGFLVPAKDPQKMAEVMERIIKDKDLADSLGQYGLLQCRNQFLAPHSANKLRTIYHDLSKK